MSGAEEAPPLLLPPSLQPVSGAPRAGLMGSAAVAPEGHVAKWAFYRAAPFPEYTYCGFVALPVLPWLVRTRVAGLTCPGKVHQHNNGLSLDAGD